jgi:signal transduction histidine kinase
MDAWLLGMKVLILGYVAADFALRGTAAPVPVVLASLAYVSCAVAALLLKPPNARRLLLLLTAAAAFGVQLGLDPAFAVLVPLPAAELVVALGISVTWAVLPSALIALLVPVDGLPAYLLVAGLSVAGYTVALGLRKRVRTLEHEGERLRSSYESLHRSAALRAGYEDELASLAQLEERNRLAQDIHDRVGHALSGGIIQLEAAAAVLDTDRGAARTLMENSVRALREGMDEVRSTLHGIKPAPEQLGVHRIRGMVEKFAAESGIAARVTQAGNLAAVTRPQWRLVADNLRECLTNTLRHSSARSLTVNIEVLRRIVKVEVRDDGRGALSVAKGLGLAGMEERTEALGGKLVVDGSRGFSVIMLLPLEPAAEGGTDAR